MIQAILKKLKGKILKETIWSFLTKGITFILFFLINIILARNLTVEDFGNWSFYLSIITIITALSYFGVNSAIGKFLAEYNHTEYLRSVIRDGIIVRLKVSLGFITLFLIVAYPLSLLLQRENYFSLFLYSTAFILFSGLVEFLKSVYMGLHRAKYNFIVNLSEFGLKTLLIFLIFVFFSDYNPILPLIGAFTLALMITSVIGFISLYQNYIRTNEKSDQTYTKEILQYSIPLFFVSLGFLVLTEVDTVMLGIFSSPTEVANYAIGKQFANKLPQISLALAMGTMPIFAKLSKKNYPKLMRIFQKLQAINITIFSFILLGIVSSAHIFVPLLYGDNFQGAIIPLYILSIHMVLFAISIPLSNFLNYRGLANKRAVFLSITMILNIIFNLILIPRFGSSGAAIGTTLSYLPYFVLNILEARREFNKYSTK